MWLYESDPNAPVHASNQVAKIGNTAYGVDVIAFYMILYIKMAQAVEIHRRARQTFITMVTDDMATRRARASTAINVLVYPGDPERYSKGYSPFRSGTNGGYRYNSK